MSDESNEQPPEGDEGAEAEGVGGTPPTDPTPGDDWGSVPVSFLGAFTPPRPPRPTPPPVDPAALAEARAQAGPVMDVEALANLSDDELGERAVQLQAERRRSAMRANLLAAHEQVAVLLERRAVWRHLQALGAKDVPGRWSSWETALISLESEIEAAKAQRANLQLYAVEWLQRERKGRAG